MASAFFPAADFVRLNVLCVAGLFEDVVASALRPRPFADDLCDSIISTLGPPRRHTKARTIAPLLVADSLDGPSVADRWLQDEAASSSPSFTTTSFPTRNWSTTSTTGASSVATRRVYGGLDAGPHIPLEFQWIPPEFQWNPAEIQWISSGIPATALVENVSYGEWLSLEFHWNSSGNSPNTDPVFHWNGVEWGGIQWIPLEIV